MVNIPSAKAEGF